ncbi:enoyl-CoA hydratase/isomerase family protein [Halobaculum sp. EA56]|uniref:enoyl-CoA hydratase/isomerase family protein n=1 Tax=Halobaculum sp. EA56 TaxID=3421648 RepID=UPI003EB92729
MHVDLEHLTVETDGAVARVTLDRPGRLNAMHYPTVRDLDAVSQLLADDEEIRLVAIRGAGRAFSTGIDLKELSSGAIDHGYHVVFERAKRRFETMDKLVLCLVHGYGLGGGLQLALSCDIRVATPSARLGLPATKESLIPGLATMRLARYVGMGRAKRLTLLGDDIDGEEAHRIGLVDHLVDDEDPSAEFDGWIDRYMDANSEGCRLSKQAMVGAFDLDHEAFLDRYLELQAEAHDSHDFEEAMAAYREDREPEWR